jgi:hypothetical protein
MAAYTVVQKYLVDDFAVLVLATPSECEVGSTIVVTGVDATFNGTYTVRAVPTTLFIGTDEQGDLEYDPEFILPNQVLYARTADDVARSASNGTVTYTPTCTWITATDVEDWLGIGTATAGDAAFLTICAAAASQFAWRRRQEAGYVDSLSVVPSQDVKLGTTMLGGAYYRQRGSLDSIASFSDMGVAPVQGLSPMIKQLLGIDRPAVA